MRGSTRWRRPPSRPDLPIPAGPSISASRPRPAAAPATSASSVASSASRSRRLAGSGGKDGADAVELGCRRRDQLLGLRVQGGEVGRAGVVEVVRRELELLLEPYVAIAQQRPGLELGRVRDAV